MIRRSCQNTAPGAPVCQTIPAGGARKRGRDCLWLGAALALWTAAAAAQDPEPIGITAPSGRALTLQEVLTDDADAGSLFRFRFVAPSIAQEMGDIEQNPADMEYLCQGFALPKLREIDANPQRIVISLASEPTEFGVPTPDVRQVFEAFSVQDDLCIWEPF